MMAAKGTNDEDSFYPCDICGLSVDEFGVTTVEASAMSATPETVSSQIGVNGYRGNFQILAEPTTGDVYQVHGTQGIVARDGSTFIEGGTATFDTKTVEVGITLSGLNDGVFTGIPIRDLAFDPANSNTILVGPVLVTESGDTEAYEAVAALQKTAGRASYTVLQVYGTKPLIDDGCCNTTPRLRLEVPSMSSFSSPVARSNV